MSSQSHSRDYNTRSKESLSVSDSLAKIESKLSNSIDGLKDEIINLKEIIIKKLQDDNTRLSNKVAFLEDKIMKLEIESNQIDQYSRRNNVEISGVPEEVSNADLEGTVISIFNAIDVDINSNDIEACHRIGAKKGNVIIRLVNRKHCLSALRNRKKLKSLDCKAKKLPKSSFYISENLTPMNSKLSYLCRELRRANLLQSCYTINGIVHITGNRVGNKTRKIFHESNLHELFPDFDFAQYDKKVENNEASH